ncbi:hypothetical protein [Halalkalibacter akibai]|uniref:Uncharacterized protein n=1 Tax=Halalkalibacter akibai (strain ATCC 43226 / DSM 21942 / CIP 109018 / JCM 9157 / 1139) TaxID=1236973 RepID=W4QP82_HALA3|nr:hypothetical protein [Halalkalibacter akibai]GAE33453.1 hypothetical protein JCM9157_456 [Halalkalibacter akibai JCM 9157]
MNKLTLLNNNHLNNENLLTVRSFNSFGIWLEGRCSWLSSDEWDFSPKFDQSNLAILVAYHKEWKIQVTVLQENSPTENGSFFTIILNNPTEFRRDIRFVYHRKMLGNKNSMSFVSPLKHIVLHYSGDNSLSLLSSTFYGEARSYVAVGEKENIWCEKKAELSLSPLCRQGRESMIVSKIVLEPFQETYGRIWELFGTSEKELYKVHDRQQSMQQLKNATEQSM